LFGTQTVFLVIVQLAKNEGPSFWIRFKFCKW